MAAQLIISTMLWRYIFALADWGCY